MTVSATLAIVFRNLDARSYSINVSPRNQLDLIPINHAERAYSILFPISVFASVFVNSILFRSPMIGISADRFMIMLYRSSLISFSFDAITLFNACCLYSHRLKPPVPILVLRFLLFVCF